MRLDWIETNILADELDSVLLDARLQGIWAIDDQTLMLEFFRADSALKSERRRFLLARLNPLGGLVWLQAGKEETPAEPPAFVMLLRKYIENARVLRVQGKYADRCFRMEFRSQDGDFTLYFLLDGPGGNVLLANEEDRVLGQFLKKDEFSTGSTFVPNQDERPQLLQAEWTEVEARIALKNEDKRFFYDCAREFTPNFLGWLMESEPAVLYEPELVQKRLDQILDEPQPRIFEKEGEITGFSVWPVLSLPDTVIHKRSRLLDALAEAAPERRQDARIKDARSVVLQLVGRELKSRRNSLEKAEEKLEGCREWPHYEHLANLMNAQRGKLQPNGRKVLLTDVFEESMPQVEADWDPKLGIEGNIQAHYNRSRKLKKGIPHTERELERLQERIRLLERIENRAKHETSLEELEELQLSLKGVGTGQERKEKHISTTSKKKARQSQLRRLLSSSGMVILAGRNDKENEFILRHAASPEDRWFHIKDVPGAHVLLKQGARADDASIREAAQLAAFLSRKKSEGRAEVMMAEPKHVRFLSGAPAGQVKVDKHDTLSVNLDAGILVKLERNLLKQAARG